MAMGENFNFKSDKNRRGGKQQVVNRSIKNHLNS